MKLSNRQKSLLYEAISEPIYQLRIKYGKKNPLDLDSEIDNDLYRLTLDIWKEIQKTLKFNE